MFDFLKSIFSVRSWGSFFKGFVVTGAMMTAFAFFGQLGYDAMKEPKAPIVSPPAEMVGYLGEPNVQIAKYPMQVWSIESDEDLSTVQELYDEGILTLGAGESSFHVGDYVLFLSKIESKTLGYIVSKVQIESTYTVKPIKNQEV